MTAQTYLGVTPPISVDPPKADELKATEDLIACLRSFNVFESDEESKKRCVPSRFDGISSSLWRV